jgi:uncharacterized protein (DUF2062 family)
MPWRLLRAADNTHIFNQLDASGLAETITTPLTGVPVWTRWRYSTGKPMLSRSRKGMIGGLSALFPASHLSSRL